MSKMPWFLLVVKMKSNVSPLNTQIYEYFELNNKYILEFYKHVYLKLNLVQLE